MPRAERWPVLARLPDVTAIAPSPQPHPEQSRPTIPSGGLTDRRFDLPGPHGNRTAPERVSPASGATLPLAATATTSITTHTPHPTAHHHFQHSTHLHPTHHAVCGPTPLLPDSDPFAFPEDHWLDRFAPVFRFLILVVLFTLAGSTILLMYRASPESDPDEITPTGVTVGNSHVGVPTAAGPLFTAPAPRLIADPRPIRLPSQGKAGQFGSLAKKPAAATNDRVANDRPAASAETAYPTTDYSSTVLPDGASLELPRVRTSQKASAEARFTGEVYEVPSRQAQHGNHESSVH